MLREQVSFQILQNDWVWGSLDYLRWDYKMACAWDRVWIPWILLEIGLLHAYNLYKHIFNLKWQQNTIIGKVFKSAKITL